MEANDEKIHKLHTAGDSMHFVISNKGAHHELDWIAGYFVTNITAWRIVNVDDTHIVDSGHH